MEAAIRALEEMDRIEVEQKRTSMSLYRFNQRVWEDIHYFLSKTGHLICYDLNGLVH